MTKISKQGIIKFPPYIHEVADVIGKLRNDANNNTEQEKAILSNDRRRKGNVLGIKGELIFMGHLTNKGYKYSYSRLLDSSPVYKADITCNGVGVDIKTIRADGWDLLVNEKSHNNEKGIVSYVFIQIFTEDMARYWIFNHSSVSKWKIKKCGLSRAYYLPLEQIKTKDNDRSSQKTNS